MAGPAFMEGELGTLVKASAAVWAALCYACTAAACIRPGTGRLLALLPVVALFYAIPFAFSSTTFRGSSAFFLCWLGTFKLLLLAAGRGPLADPSLSLLHFACSAPLPVKLRQPQPKKSKPNQDPLSSSPAAAAKIIVSGAVIPFIIYGYQFKDSMRHWQLLAMYAAHVYFSLELLLATVRARLPCSLLMILGNILSYGNQQIMKT